MIINSCTAYQQGQNMLQLHVSINCPVKRQAIETLPERSVRPDENPAQSYIRLHPAAACWARAPLGRIGRA
jgi:hypothetical protein